MEKIVKTYYVGKPNELEILHGIDLTVNQGEFVSIVGESGSGKSTLMNIIGVLDRQTSGSYYLEGQDVNGMTDEVRSAVRNRRIGFVFQNFNLLPRANALKNVMVPLIYGEEKTKNAKERAMEMLAMVGMDGRADHRPNELSGGQKQRVAIARAIVNLQSFWRMSRPERWTPRPGIWSWICSTSCMRSRVRRLYSSHTPRSLRRRHSALSPS